jgi:hypothetical protein
LQRFSRVEAKAAFKAEAAAKPSRLESGGKRVPRALFDFSVPPYFNEGFPVLKKFRADGYDCTVVLEWDGRGADEAAEECRKLGCTLIELPSHLCYHVDAPVDRIRLNPDTAGSDGHEPWHSRRRLYRWLMRRIPLVGRLIQLVWLLPSLVRLRRFGEAMVRRAGPDVVVFGPFNSYGRASNAVFAAARRFGIPTVCVPFMPLMGEPYNILERLESVRRGNVGPTLRADYDLFSRLCAILFRRWTRSDATLRIFHRDPVEVIAGRLIGLNLTDGWQKPSPYFDRVFVPSEHSIHCLRIANFPMDRVVLSGMPRMDTIINSMSDERAQREFFDSIRLPVGAPYVVFNVEPAAEHYVATWDEHWRCFRETIGAISSSGIPVVLSLHPLCAPAHYNFVEDEYGAIVRHPRNIYELVAHSHLVVSSVCSTLLATQMFHKPTLVYDYYGVPDDVAKFFDLSRYIVCRDSRTLKKEFVHLVGEVSQAGPPPAVKLPLACEIILAEVEGLLAAKPRHVSGMVV